MRDTPAYEMEGHEVAELEPLVLNAYDDVKHGVEVYIVCCIVGAIAVFCAVVCICCWCIKSRNERQRAEREAKEKERAAARDRKRNADQHAQQMAMMQQQIMM